MQRLTRLSLSILSWSLIAGGYHLTAILDIAKHPEAQDKIKLEDALEFEFSEGGRNLATVLKADAEKLEGFLGK